MQVNKKIFSFLLLSVLISSLSGCQGFKEPIEVIFKSESGGRTGTLLSSYQPVGEKQVSVSAPKRFEDSTAKGQTAVESAIELSKKYASLSKEMFVLRQRNHDLISENRRLKEQLAPCQRQLEQAQKELTEANALLIEMRIELNNWKTDILGFRDEMRHASSTQLDALLKILTILGGEVNTDSEQNEVKSSDAISANQPAESPLKETSILSKSNE